MGKALIIAEKPSVAGDIARALGGFARHQDYYESEHTVLSSAIGHLLELKEPESFLVKRGKWTFSHLPVIPDRFELEPTEDTASRLRLLLKLLARKDVTHLVNACDAGREGELIFRNIVRHAGTAKPIRRLWLQSMTPSAIRQGFAALRADAELLPLADAAQCRAEADWLVGINGTRAMTAFNSKSGGFQLTTVGRVQTPTLAIVVEREERIRRFVARDYWEIHGTFEAQAGAYLGRWFDERFAKEKNGDADLRAERVWDLAKAQAVQAKCLGRPGTVTEESKPTTQLSPLLFDLTSLQREANGRFGFSAQRTLQLAQALYERHKALTYPRTDSRALPEDYLAPAREALQAMSQTAYAAFAGQILQQGWLRPNKRIFNNAKVTDHFAIVPTPLPPKALNEAEAKVYDLVAKRFLAVFFPPAEFMVTTRITRVADEPFKSEGKVLLNAGWLAVYGREVPADDTPTLTPVQRGEIVQTREVKLVQAQTKPPPRFNEATLLSAMEGAGKLLDDEELREAMSARGLGTPATRAAIIEGLIKEKYLLRLGRDLQPTPKAFSLVTLLRGLGVPELTSPELTGDWEFQLKQMEQGRLSRPEFMSRIAEMTRHIVAQAKGHESDTVPGDYATLKAPCPKCGGVVRENYKKFQCQNAGCGFGLWRIVSGRQFAPEEVEELLTRRTLGPLSDFRSRQGRSFSSSVKLGPEFRLEFDFGQNGGNGSGDDAEPVDFSGQESLGKCPQCGARVFENGPRYVCEKGVEKGVEPGRSCGFRSGKLILQQPVAREEMVKLLATGKTSLLEKFISRKGRPFAAYLVLKEGQVGFEFQPRPARGSKGPRKPAPEKKPAAPVDFSGREPLGPCPKCGGRVFALDTAYVCERSQAPSRPCKFRMGRTILQREVEPAQVAKLLATGRTDLLDKFISRQGRPFSAHLVVQEEDKAKVGFEFQPREGQA